MKKYISIGLIGTLLFVAGCKKDEIPPYSGPEGISFVVANGKNNEISYSFAINLTPKEKDTLYLDMRTLGAPKEYARKIKLKGTQNSTARLNIDYELIEYELPAGAVDIKYPLIVKKTAEMSEGALSLFLEVDETGGFVKGVSGEVIGGTRNVNDFKIEISNTIIEPSYWNSEARSVFGRFSVTKFKFMMEVLGIVDFSKEAIGTVGQYSFPVKLRNALLQYVEKHGEPLSDEYGIIRF